jgi:hypothetical protein
MNKFKMISLFQIELIFLCLLLDINLFSQITSHSEIVLWHRNCPIILTVVDVRLFCYNAGIIHILCLFFLNWFYGLHYGDSFFSMMKDGLLCIQYLPSFLKRRNYINVFSNFSSFN